MERFAFSLDEADKSWLEDRSDELDISAAELLRRLIADARESDTPVIHDDTDGDSRTGTRVNHRDTLGDTGTGGSDTPGDTVGDTDVNHRDTDSDTVAELRERVDALEARVNEVEAGGAIAPTPLSSDTAADADVEPGPEVREALESSGWSRGRNEEERQRDATVAAWALAYLREAGEELRKGDFPLDALDDDRKVDTVWLQVIRPALLAVARETDAVAVDDSEQRYRWVGE
jgi:hypothetical protein